MGLGDPRFSTLTKVNKQFSRENKEKVHEEKGKASVSKRVMEESLLPV